MKVVKAIGFTIPSENDDYIELESFSSLADVDIAVFAPDFSHTSYSTFSGYRGSEECEGKKLYNKSSSVKIIEHRKHWNKELNQFVARGGTLFVILTKKEDFYIYTGKKDFSGTGKSQKETHHVSPFFNYAYLPFNNIEYNIATGKTIIPKSDLVIDLYNQFKDLFSFEMDIQSANITKGIFTTKSDDRILGASLKIKKGFVIFLPKISFYVDKFKKYDPKKDAHFWTEDAIKQGEIFINCIVKIDKSLKEQSSKTPKPNWINAEGFELSTTTNTRAKIAKTKKEIEKHNNELINLNKILEEQESLKDLLFETGKPLEIAVNKALRIIGYEAENYDDGELELDQIIFSPEGDRFIGECEGKDNKDIDITKFRQLLDGLNADYEKENVDEKASGLLFGNPQRLLNPTERSLDFTIKCKSGANREKIGLIKTSDLFNVCKIMIENNNEEYALKCRQAIKNQMGNVVKFPEYE
ncbi:MAG: hypothetical protein M3Q58_11565 [Bacteroidota bacterium]|nr:hypothetical protein [Bacteroidota bacterium]